MKATTLVYEQAKTIEQALDFKQTGEGLSKFLGGGQTLMPMMGIRVASPDRVIDLSRIATLRESTRDGERLAIGAAVTHAMIEDGRVEDPARGYLAFVAHGIAYRSIRNKGTIGGSLAHADPAADWPTALLALNAVVVLRGAKGEREVSLADFQVGMMATCLEEDEIIARILVPFLSAQARWSYQKFCRKVGEFAHSIGAVVIDPTSQIYNVVLGAGADQPARLIRVSEHLAAGIGAEQVRASAFQELLGADLAEVVHHEPDSYDFHLHRTMVTRAIIEALNP